MDTKPPTSDPWRQSPASRPLDSADLSSSTDMRSVTLHPPHTHLSSLAHLSSAPAPTPASLPAAPSLLPTDRRPSELSPPDDLSVQPLSKRPFPDLAQQQPHEWRPGPLHHPRNFPAHSAPPASLQDAYLISQDSIRKRPRHPLSPQIPSDSLTNLSRPTLTYIPPYDADTRHPTQTIPPAPINRHSPTLCSPYPQPELPSRRIPTPDDSSFLVAAEAGARAQLTVDSTSGEGVLESYKLGISIVRASKLYANQRRSNRLLPGGSDSTTAACYMIGGTPDSILSPLLSRVSPCDPREERCKAVERVLKDKTRGAICALNGENPREARADNLAAVRICEVVADILVAHSSRRLMESRMELFARVSRQDVIIKQLREELEALKRGKEASTDAPADGSTRADTGAAQSNKYGIS